MIFLYLSDTTFREPQSSYHQMLLDFPAKIFSYQAGTLQESGTGRNTPTPLIYNPLNRLTVRAMPKPLFLAGSIPYGGRGAAVEAAAGFCVRRSQIRIRKGFFGGGGASLARRRAAVPICRAVLSSQTSAAVGSNRLGCLKRVRGDRRGGRGCK